MPSRHPPAVRHEAVRLVAEGGLPRIVASRLVVNATTVYAWLHEDAPELVGNPTLRCWRCRPQVEPDLAAYAELLGLYLGDGWLTQTPRGYWFLSIACCDDWPGLARDCEDVMRAVLATSVCRVRRKGCHDVKSYSQHWLCLFPQHGPGKKHTRTITLELAWRPNGAFRISVARRDAVAALDEHVGLKH